ncbi:uncharacterized protein [Montipora capricornis]|uniref:uncharacterized protein isoform X2 n=1 Tax=Montipora capricornis TaxID=246305 RepID=UPI0035F21646
MSGSRSESNNLGKQLRTRKKGEATRSETTTKPCSLHFKRLRGQVMYPGNREETLSRKIPFIAYMFVTLILEVSATNETSVNMNNSSRCTQAETAVSAFSRNNSCIFYNYTLDGFCKGIITTLYVFGNQTTIAYGERETKTFQSYFNFFEISEKCSPTLIDLYCHYHFPSCDTTLEKPRKRMICRRTCNHVNDVLCKSELVFVREAAKTAPRFDYDMINCSTYPVASGGDAPECYQSSSLPDDDTRSTDCYHGIGVGYRGNVNVTRSGRTCQRWITQCPHRHWRIPEDVDKSQNDSNNMCRNPDGSAPDGPWCYTTDPNMRWEYCNISRCPPRVPRKIPTLPDGFALNATTIYLSWEAIPTSLPSGKEPLLGYRVRYQRLGSPLHNQVNVSNNVTEISLANLTPQTEYQIEVNGFNAIGHGEASTAIIIKTLQSGLVIVDVTLQVKLDEGFRDDVHNRNSSSFVKLKYNIERMINTEFNKSSDLKVYSLRMKNFRRDDLQADLLMLVIINANTTTKSEAVGRLIEGLRPAKVLGITSIFVVGKPQPPENVRAADVQKWYFVLTWQQPKYGVYYQIDNFTIEQKKGTAASFNVLETLPCEKTRINVKDLEPATEYTMRLSSNNKYGRSSAILLKQTTLPDKFLLKLMVTIVLPFGLAILFITIVCIKFGPPCKSNVEDKSQIEIELPMKEDWREFPRSQLQLQVRLGQGAFGEVYKGELKNEEEVITCAVKKLKDDLHDGGVPSTKGEHEVHEMQDEIEVNQNGEEYVPDFIQEPLLFEYDAFIIYSSKDEEWVRGTLLPTLEDKHGLKCCIHYRDFIPGVLYRQNMVNSVYASKKTVAVVSKNFFNSGFCESEFEYALLRLAERRDDSLIVIKLDDIDTRKLPLEVRKRSYIDCPKSIEKETWETKLVKSLKFKNP